MLSGTVLSEGQLFVYELFTSKLSKTQYGIALDAIFGKHNAKQVKKMYPFDIVPGSKDGREAFNILATDLIFGCPLRNVTRGLPEFFGARGCTNVPVPPGPCDELRLLGPRLHVLRKRGVPRLRVTLRLQQFRWWKRPRWQTCDVRPYT